jgi:hypothetical protein
MKTIANNPEFHDKWEGTMRHLGSVLREANSDTVQFSSAESNYRIFINAAIRNLEELEKMVSVVPDMAKNK